LSCFLAAFSPRRPKSLDFARFGVFPHLPQAAGLVHSAASPLSTEPAAFGFGRIILPHVGATSVFLVLGEYALGLAAKAAQTADTGVTGWDWRFSCTLSLCFQ
jgi:hypothetical protein